jgi:uncharacterized protein (UPF0332 family)
MTEEQRELLLQARDSLKAAKWLMKGEYPGYAAARAYYAMFYIQSTSEAVFAKLWNDDEDELWNEYL